MNWQSDITQAIANLTNRLNEITTSAKKIFELTWQSVLNPASKIHVSNPANASEFITVQQILDAALSYRQNQLIEATISVDGNDVTVDAGAKWIINNLNYELASDFTETIPYAETGYTRNDILVGNESNFIYRVVGPETEGISPTPNVPLNTVLITVINVTDSTIGNTPPFIGTDFELIVNKQNSLAVDGTGKKYPTIDAVNTMKSDIDSDISDINDILPLKADLISGKVPSSQLPSYVDDILEGYLLSNVFYEDSGHTIVIPAEIGKIYIDLTFGEKNREYRYSGSIYVQITNGLIANTDDVPESANNLYYTSARSVLKEDKTNKTDDIETNKTSSVFYASAKAVVTWLLNYLFTNAPAKASTLVDADLILAGDSADSFKTKTRTFAQFKATLKSYFDGFYMPSNFNQSRWQFSDFTNTAANQGPFVGVALATGSLSVVTHTSTADLNSLGAIVINSSTSANSGYRMSDAGGVAMLPRSGVTFLGRIGMTNDSTGRDKIIRIGLHSTQNQVAPVNGVYLEISGTSASFKSTASSVTSSSSSVILTEYAPGAAVNYYSVFITFTADRTAKCVLYDYTMANILSITFTTADNMMGIGSRVNSGIVGTITTAGAAAAICQVDYMGVGLALPSFLNSY